MKLLIATILMFSPNTPRKPGFVHTRERIDSQSWVDSVSITPETYVDVRYDYNPDGMGITMLGCFVRGVKCDSPAQWKAMVSR